MMLRSWVASVALLAVGAGQNPLSNDPNTPNLVLFDFERAAKDLPVQQKRARDLGLPLTAQQLVTPSVPASQNWEPTLAKVRGFLESPEGKRRAAPVQEATFRRRPIVERKRLLAPLNQTLDQLVAVRNRPHLVRSRPWTKSGSVIATTFPHLSTESRAASLLLERAILRSETNQLNLAQQDLSTVFRLAQVGQRSPVFYEIAYALSMRHRAEHAARTVASRHSQNRALVAILQRLSQVTREPLSAQMLWGYLLVAALEAAAMSRDELPDYLAAIAFFPTDGGASARGPYHASILMIAHGIPYEVRRDAFQARALRTVNELVTASRTSDFRALDAKLRAELEVMLAFKDPTLILPYGVYSQSSDNFKFALMADRGTRGTDAFLSALRYRQTHGRSPKTLADAGFNAVDPMTGQPFRYVPTANGFRISTDQPTPRFDGESPRPFRVAFPAETAASPKS